MNAPTLSGPTPVVAPDAPLDVWLTARRRGIGGSDVAAIVGVSKYAGPTRVYYDKLGVLPDEDNAAMEWGRRLETAVRGKFVDEHPEFHVRQGPGLVAHPDRPWQLATIDGLVAESPAGDPIAVVEVKTGRAGADDWGDELTDEIPMAYLCQVTWYLDVYGLSVGHLAVLLDGRDYREYVIEYDATLAAKLRAHCSAFWQGHVLARVPPDPDALADTAVVLDAVHQPKKKSRADLPPEVVAWARIYGNAHQDVLRAEQRKRDAGNHLRAAFIAAGSPHQGWVDGRKVASYPICGEPTREVVAWADLEADHPDLVAQYRRTEPVVQQRRLIVSKEFTAA